MKKREHPCRLLSLLLASVCLCSCEARGSDAVSSAASSVASKASASAVSAVPVASTPSLREKSTMQPAFSCMAYIPASTSPDALEAYAQSFALLKRVTIITGLAWNAQGEVLQIDPGYEPLFERLQTLRAEFGFQIYATAYPQSALIRASTAGESVDTPIKRETLTRALCDYVGAKDALDGIDLDWETPKDVQEWQSYAALIDELGGVLGEMGKGLSVALYPEDVQKLTPTAIRALSALNLMTYDQFDENGHHATFSMMQEAVHDAVEAGYAPEQIMAGIPAYGRPLDAGTSWPLYKDQVLLEDQNLAGNVFFNSASLAHEKTAFARANHLQGVFLFHLMGDFPAEHDLSLLRACTDEN